MIVSFLLGNYFMGNTYISYIDRRFNMTLTSPWRSDENETCVTFSYWVTLHFMIQYTSIEFFLSRCIEVHIAR